MGASAWVLLCLAACGTRAPNSPAVDAPAAAGAPAGDGNATAARGQSGPIRLVGCRQGGCLWERRRSERDVPVAAGGTLKELVSDTGRSSHPDGEVPDAYDRGIEIDWSGSRTTYVRCSVPAPMVAFRDEGDDLIVHHLDLFATAGYSYASAQTYMRTCHDRDFTEDEAVLRGLGYRPGTRNEQVEAAGIEAIDG